MKENLQTCNRILSSVLPVFIISNLELLYCFVHFCSSYGEALMHYRQFVGQLKISWKMGLIASLGGPGSSLLCDPKTRRDSTKILLYICKKSAPILHEEKVFRTEYLLLESSRTANFPCSLFALIKWTDRIREEDRHWIRCPPLHESVALLRAYFIFIYKFIHGLTILVHGSLSLVCLLFFIRLVSIIIKCNFTM